MKAIILIALLTVASPALAQHQGHSMPMEQSGDHADMQAETPHSEHQADPHAGHSMPAQMDMDDPHAGHTMPAEQNLHEGHSAPAETDMDDPHAGHTMSAEPDPHAGHGMAQSDQDEIPQAGPPPEAFTGPAHAADTVFSPETMAEAREDLRQENGAMTVSLFSLDRLEAQFADGEDAYVWEINARHGGDIDRLWIKSEGEGEFGGALEEVEVQALWSHAIGPFFDLQAGVRGDFRPGPDTGHLVLGVQGLAPYFFEVDAAGFVSDDGDFTARFEAEYDQRLTQRLIVQPRIEAGFSAQDIPELGTGSGLTSLDAGLRLRYEFVPEFAPYVGVEWQKQFGDTADFTRAAGGDPDRWVLVTGIRLWF